VSFGIEDVQNVTFDTNFVASPWQVYRVFDFSLAPAADALKVIERLQSEGFVAYLAGGCVRDGLLGRPPKDFDVATDATPDAVREVFGHRRTLAFGASFGVIGVMGQSAEPTEVATFRSDGTYSDGRRPDQVHFGSAQQDALRRDYTINGLFYDPIDDSVIDFVQGRADLAGRLVRAIGDPCKRIAEDKLRMLRAVRFAATLGFSIDPATIGAIRQRATEVNVTSGERIGAEMRRMLGNRGASVAIAMLADTHLLPEIWPGLGDQPASLDLAVRLAAAVQPPDFAACLAGVIAATAAHPVQTVQWLADHWRWSTDERSAIEQAIRHRDTVLNAGSLPWSVVQPVLMLGHHHTTLAAAEAWAIATGTSRAGVDLCRHRLAKWEPARLNPKPLITGQDLISLGYRPGPPFKEALLSTRAAQLDGEIDSTHQAVEMAKRILEPN
jgi:tRNA nucleotidyltransferase/poly(A) polymerase